jgi:hypothetical protein
LESGRNQPPDETKWRRVIAFNIPGSNDGGSSGPFLARVQYDARSGFFTNVDRVQTDAGWSDRPGEPYRGLTAAFDFGSMEAGYIKFASPPAFVLVPFVGDGTPYPPQPQEMTEAKPGEKPRKAFLPGFRVKLLGKAFGSPEPRYFAHTAKGVLGTMEDLYAAFAAAPEAARGMIPVVNHASTKTIETTGPRGTTKNYAPVWSIVQWVERPAAFGERTCPAPMAGSAPAPAAPPVHVAAAAMAPAVSADPLPF